MGEGVSGARYFLFFYHLLDLCHICIVREDIFLSAQSQCVIAHE